jgi:antitoxin PrlF
MGTISEFATMTSKGQVTLPKSIRQVLGVDAGSRLSFTLKGDEVVIARIGIDEHKDPAIAAFLGLLENDIAQGSNVSGPSKALAASLIAALEQTQEPVRNIAGDVAL